MPVPKRKRSKSRRDKRFANKGLKETAITTCSNPSCDEPLVPHQACRKCGFYKNTKVMMTKADRMTKRVEKVKKKKETVKTEVSSESE
jgi:large subunit ribosomal protein L32